MFSLTSFVGRLIGKSKRLSDLEKRILDSVRGCLDNQAAVLWDKQVLAINKVQRLPEGVEVNFYRMSGGRPTFNPELAFANKADELQVARLELNLANDRQKLVANVWFVQGFLFSIEYEGCVSYFEEAAGMAGAEVLKIDCELKAALSATA